MRQIKDHLSSGNNKQFGVWLGLDDGKSDVHIYVCQEWGVVLGNNCDYTDDIQHTDTCISIKDDKIIVQYTDVKTGEAKFRELNKGEFYKLFRRFLEDARMYAVANS